MTDYAVHYGVDTAFLGTGPTLHENICWGR